MSLPGLIVLYRWRLLPGLEEQFVDGWSTVTRELRTKGSLGSRLHRGDDGLWYGYAQWPDAASRVRAFAEPGDEAGMTAMKTAVAESFPDIILSGVADYLVPSVDD